MALIVSMLSGCAQLKLGEAERTYETVGTAPNRDTDEAQRKYARAMSAMEHGQYDRAEQLLREALIADVNYGPAHNSLGKLYFDQRKFYLAAWEFEYAIKVMPIRPEPYNNLGLVYESVGKLDEAVMQYEMAVDQDRENAIYLGNLVRARVRRGDKTSDLRYLLERLIFLDTRRTWVDWAKGVLVLGGIETEKIVPWEGSSDPNSPTYSLGDELIDPALRPIEILPEPNSTYPPER